jgi:hypothetical protein
MSFDFNITLDFNWGAPAQPAVPPAANPFLNAVQAAEKAALGYADKLKAVLDKPMPIYIDWSFTQSPAFAMVNANTYIEWLHKRVRIISYLRYILIAEI